MLTMVSKRGCTDIYYPQVSGWVVLKRDGQYGCNRKRDDRGDRLDQEMDRLDGVLEDGYI